MKRMGLIYLVAALLVLSSLGVGYAYWSQDLTVSGTVKTGTLDWKFVNPFRQIDTSEQFLDSADNNDYNFNQQDLDEEIWQIDRNVAYVSGTRVDSHLIVVSMENTYPGYYNELYTFFMNNGTMPLKIRGVKLTYNGEQYTLTDNLSTSIPVITHDGCFAFRWIGDGTKGLVIPPSTSVKFSEDFAIYVISPLPSTPDHHQTYDFTITLEGAQFNDDTPP
jgi:predicted ribosomally synthesized peptide with SipW-like signal peptide